MRKPREQQLHNSAKTSSRKPSLTAARSARNHGKQKKTPLTVTSRNAKPHLPVLNPPRKEYSHQLTPDLQVPDEEGQLWRMVFENANDAVLLLDSSGNVISHNRQAERMYGYSGREWSAMKLSDLRAPSTLHLVNKQLDEPLVKKGARWETRHVRKDGAVLPVEVSTRPFILLGHRRFVHIIRDMTELKAAQSEARKHKMEMREARDLLEGVTNGTNVLVAAEDTSYRYRFFNETYREEIKRLTGREVKLGDSMIDLFSHMPELRDTAARQWSNAIQGATESYRIEFGEAGRYRRWYDVRHAPIRDARGRIIGAGEVALDITREVQLEQDLMQSQARFRVAQEMLPIGFLILQPIRDGQSCVVDYEITYANPIAVKTFVGVEGSMVGRRLLDILTQKQKFEDLADRFVHVLETGQGDDWDFEYARADETKWFHIMLVKLGEELAVSFADITARKETEESLRKGLEERTVLFRELEHRVKNTFSMINSLISLETGQASHGAAKTVLQSLDRRIRTLARLYSTLHKSGEVKSIRLDWYLEEVVRSIVATFVHQPERVSFQLKLDEIETDTRVASPLGLILNEFVSNSLQHAFPDNREGILTISLRDGGEDITLEVTDDGVGTPAGFDFSTSPGLGLSLVRMLVHQLGGEAIHERNDKTRFAVHLRKSTPDGRE
jgi:PAS domain S-box-containing protein